MVSFSVHSSITPRDAHDCWKATYGRLWSVFKYFVSFIVSQMSTQYWISETVWTIWTISYQMMWYVSIFKTNCTCIYEKEGASIGAVCLEAQLVERVVITRSFETFKRFKTFSNAFIFSKSTRSCSEIASFEHNCCEVINWATFGGFLMVTNWAT